MRITNLGDEAVTLRPVSVLNDDQLPALPDENLKLKEDAPIALQHTEKTDADEASARKEQAQQRAREKAVEPLEGFIQRAQRIADNTWDVPAAQTYYDIRTEGHNLLVSLKDGDVETARKRVEEFISRYQKAVDHPPAPVSREQAQRRRAENRLLTPEVKAVYETAYETLPLWTPEETAAALKVIREQNERLEEKGAAKLNAVKEVLRETMGEKYGRVLRSSQAENIPVHLALPVDRSASPEDLALLVTLITSPNDEIYLFLQGEGSVSAEDYQRQLNQALGRMEVTPKLLKQIQVMDIDSPKQFTAQIQRLLGPLQKDTVSGIAVSRRSLLAEVPAMKNVRKMFGEKLKHPYALAFIAMMALRAEKQAEHMGQHFDLSKWMTQNGMDADFAETIARAMNAMKRVTAAA